MNSFWTYLLAIIGSITGTISLVFSFRKDAYHLRLDVTNREYDVIVLGINNDSAVCFGVLSVGYFTPDLKITWIKEIGNYKTNKYIEFPFTVEPRSLFPVSFISSKDVPSKRKRYGYCVQLETGRLYSIRNSSPAFPAILMSLISLVSRISRGSWTPGISAPRIPPRPY